MRYLSLALLSLALCTTSRLSAQLNGPGDTVGATLTLPQAVSIAIKNNLAVNQSDLSSQSFRIGFDQSWEYMLPTLSANGGQQINFGRTISSVNNQYSTTQYSSGSLGVNAGLILFHGLEYQNNIREQRYAWNASKLDLQQQKDNITLNVLLAYLQILSNRDQLTLVREQAQVDSTALVLVNDKNKEGALSPISNLTDLQGQYANDMINIAQAANSLEQSKISLFALLNVPYNRDVEYQNTITATNMDDYQASPDSIFKHALDIIPSVRSAQLKVYQYERALAVARGGYWPTISFGANISTNWTNAPGGTFTTTGTAFLPSNSQFVNSNGTGPIYDKVDNGYYTYPNFGNQFKNNRGESIGLSASIPILNGFQTRNNVRNAKLTLRNYRYQNAYARNQLQQTIEIQYQNMMSAYKQYKFYKDQAAAYEESFRITNIRFTSGVITSDVYIQAKGRSDLAELNLAAAKYIFIFRTKVLDYYQGKLVIN